MRKIIFTILTILLIGGANLKSQQLPNNIRLKTTKGEIVNFKDYIKDDYVILSFWATTCRPRISELRALMSIRNKWKNKIRIIAVSTDDARSMAKVRSMVKGNKWDFDVLIDFNKNLYNNYKLTSIPTTMIIDRKGNTHYLHVGYAPGDEEVLIEKALEIINK